MTKSAGKFQVMDFLRSTSVSCVPDQQESALNFLKSGDIRSFTDIINTAEVEAGGQEEQHWVNQPVEAGGGSLLEEAVRVGHHAAVAVLVRAGAARDLNSPGPGQAPLHTAAQLGDPRALALLLGEDGRVDPGVRAGDRRAGWAPIHFAAQGETAGHTECLELLLARPEVDVDIRDIRSVQTPLFLAVEAKNTKSIESLIRNGANIDAKCGRKTIREYLTENLPDFRPNSIQKIKSREVMLNLESKMMDLLRVTKKNGENYQADLANFRTFVHFIRTGGEPSRLTEVLNLACEKGLDEQVALLLRKGISPNNSEHPLLEAAYRGHHGVLRALLADPRINLAVERSGTRETFLHLLLRAEHEAANRADYEQCLRAVLGADSQVDGIALSSLVNRRDGLGNTALHYATQKWGDTAVKSLLELGANIGIKNHWQEIPIAKIRPQTMEEFLDEHCLNFKGDIMHENFEVSFQYNFLAPDKEALPEKYKKNSFDYEDPSALPQERKDSEALPETESLWYMGQSREHRHLLKHPVITSFLWYKWQRMRKYFNRNLRIYFLFVFLLTWYVFREFGSFTHAKFSNNVFYVLFVAIFPVMLFFMIRDWVYDIKDSIRLSSLNDISQRGLSCSTIASLVISNWFEALTLAFIVGLIMLETLLKPGLIALLAILFLFEVFQLMVSLKRYVFSLENWIELSMIAIVTVILINDPKSFEINRNLAAFSILLSWSKMITLIGKHPKNNRLNIYVTMFFKVLKSFFFFLSWYGLFIVAFGLSFFIMLHEDVKKEEHNLKSENDYVYFNTTFLSIVKTLTMFVGELEFSDIPINLESSMMPCNYIFFLLFVFLIVVVLMNLLNGLAVREDLLSKSIFN